MADGTPEKISFQPQGKGLGCLKPETKAMIAELIAKIGPIQITSTCGGRHARNSQHYSGRAIDFRPMATSSRKAAAAARANPTGLLAANRPVMGSLASSGSAMTIRMSL